LSHSDSTTKLTVTTTGMGPRSAVDFSDGIVYIVSGLESYVETGEALPVVG